MEDPMEDGTATHSSILVRRIPWTEEPGGLWSMGLQRVEHDRVTRQQKQRPHKGILFRNKWNAPMIYTK